MRRRWMAAVAVSACSWPATVMLNNIAGAVTTPYSRQMAAAIPASVPTMIIYVRLGRFFMRGLMAGALKG